MNPYFHALLADIAEVKDITAIGETLAYTWFGRPNYAYSEVGQKYWIGSTKDTPSGTTQHITEYDINNDSYTTTQVGTAFEKDDHNQAQILIRESDKRLLAFYSEHSGSRIRYRISTNPLDGKVWEEEITLNPIANYSYVSPYQASNGNIFIFFRAYSSGGFRWYFMKSTDGGVTFGSAIEFYYNGGVQAYMISSQKNNEVHFAVTNGHPENNPTLNINSYHFYFDMLTETAHKSDGSTVSLPASISNLTTVQTTSGNDTSWILDITFKNGFPRMLYVFYPEGRANNYQIKELYFIEWNGSAWVNTHKIAETLNGYIEDDGNYQEAAYPPASRFDTANPDIIWMPKQVNGVLEIHKVDITVNPIYIEQLTFDSEVDNWRPISVPSPVNNLLWLKNNFYNMYTDYDITLQTKTVQV